MKPLTIEQLKELPVGDWVWFIRGDISSYRQIASKDPCGCLLESRPYESWLNYSDYGKMWLAYKNKEHAEVKGEIVELPYGWLDTLKLLTVAAMCYADIDDMIARGMRDSKELGDLFVNIPRVQGSSLQWSLQDLAESKLDCNKIKGFEEILNAMPNFKSTIERRLAELRGE